jgi:serine/threonine-protein kinase
VAVAYQHVREDPTPPSAYDDTLPGSVDSVVLKAMAKNPVNRYQSADEMREDLLRAASGQPVLAVPFLPEPATTIAPPAGLRVPHERRRRGPVLAVFAAILIGVAVLVAILVKGVLGNDSGLISTPAVVGMTQQDATVELAKKNLQVGEVSEKFDPKPAGTVIAQSPEAGFLIGKGDSVDLTVSKGIEMTVVPQIIGQSQAEAEAQLKDAKLVIGQIITRDVNLPAGQVLAMQPAPGTQIPAGTKVTLVVASGKVQVPDLRGKTQDEAVKALQMLGFSIGIEPRPDPSCIPGDPKSSCGKVLDQRPVNSLAPRGSTVVIAVAQPPASPTPSPSPTDTFPSPEPSTEPSAQPSPQPPPSPTPPKPPPRPAPPAPRLDSVELALRIAGVSQRRVNSVELREGGRSTQPAACCARISRRRPGACPRPAGPVAGPASRHRRHRTDRARSPASCGRPA